MPKKNIIEIHNLGELKLLAKKINKLLKKFNFPIFLNGEIGAGKTTFAKILIKLLNTKIVNVGSPTFNIANTYEYNNNINIWHFDLYRIIDENELAIFDMPDILNNQIAIIEWANKFSSLIDYNPNTLIIEIIVKNKIREFNFYCKNEMILNNLKEKNR